LGHILQRRMFPGTTAVGSGCIGSWSFTSSETESCAVTEGWASYVAAVSWWNPGGANDAAFSGNDIEAATPLSGTCSNNTIIPGQAAKAFWDLDDFNNEGAAGAASVADNQNSGTT